MNKQVFIINGSGGVGKDTFVNLFTEYIKNTMNVMNYSSVDEIKSIAKSIGWNGEKTEKNRRFLSDLKILCTNFNDYPFTCMKHCYNLFMKSKDSYVLFLHIREPIEIEKAKQTFNAKTILIKRDTIKQITSNVADSGVFNYNYDIIINNDGDLESLKKKVECFAKLFLKKRPIEGTY